MIITIMITFPNAYYPMEEVKEEVDEENASHHIQFPNQ